VAAYEGLLVLSAILVGAGYYPSSICKRCAAVQSETEQGWAVLCRVSTGNG